MSFITIGRNNPHCNYTMDGIHDEVEFQAALDGAFLTNSIVKVEDGIRVNLEGDLEITAPIIGKFTLTHKERMEVKKEC